MPSTSDGLALGGVFASDTNENLLLISSSIDDAVAAKTAAETAEANALASEGAASNSETNAASSASAAANSATAAQTAETAAELAETHAETAETNAETAETNAELAEVHAETAEAASLVSQSAAAASQSSATASASSATASASSATSSATDAQSSEDDAATSESNAATSATASASSATASAGSASTATTQAATATTKAATATTQAATATTKAAESLTSANNSATSATAAQSSEDDAAADLVLTNADVVSTHADVVLTNADVVSTNTDVTAAALSATNAATSESNAASAVSTAITALVDTAPATMNTLNELAAALGDDPAFATTVSNNIATKLPLAGGAMTGAITTNSTFDGVDVAVRDAVLTTTTTTANAALPKAGGTMTGDTLHGDNVKAKFGASSDLQIYHASAGGGHSYIKEIGTGNLRIQASDITLQDSDGNGFISLIDTGTGGTVYLKHNNANKLSTTSTGIDVTGTVTADGLVVENPTAGTVASPNYANINFNGYLGRSKAEIRSHDTSANTLGGAFEILTADSSNNLKSRVLAAPNGDISFYNTAGTGAKFFWDASAENLGLGTVSPAHTLHAQRSVADFVAKIENDNGTDAGHGLWVDTRWNTADNVPFKITSNSGTSTIMHVRGSGKVGIGTSSPSSTLEVAGMLTVSGDGNDLLIDSNDENLVLIGNRSSSGIGLDQGYFRMKSEGDNTVVIDTAGNSYFNGGNVGIGTSSPAHVLHINHVSPTVYIEDGNNGTGGTAYRPNITFGANGSDVGFIGMKNNKHLKVAASNVNSAAVIVETGGAERMRIDSSGNVGIGTSSPDTLLHVAGADTAILRLENTDTSLAVNQLVGGIEFEKRDPSGAGAGVFGGIRMKVEDSVGANAYMAFSTGWSGGMDVERLKIQSGGGLITTPIAGNHAVFNDGGVDSDFRVESNDNTHMLFVNGGVNSVGIGTSSTANGLLTVSGAVNGHILNIGTGSSYQGLYVDGGTGLGNGGIDLIPSTVPGSGTANVYTRFASRTAGSGTTKHHVMIDGTLIANGGAIFNDNSIDTDFRVESDTNTHALFLRGSDGNVGIGTSSPDAWLAVSKDNSNSGNQFHVSDTEGNTAAIRTYTTGSPAGLILNHYYAKAGSGYEYMRYADIVANVGNGAATTLRFITKNAANVYSTTVIDNNGNVGIGIAPATKLHSVGDISVGVGNSKEAVLQAAGSGRVAASPAFSFRDDLDTGMFNPNTDNTIAFTTGGTERFRITSAGGLEGTSTTGGHITFNNNTVDSDFRVASLSQTHALFVQGSSGNVGIGEASPATFLDLAFTTTDQTQGYQIHNKQYGGYGSAITFMSRTAASLGGGSDRTAGRIRVIGGNNWASDANVDSLLRFEAVEDNTLRNVLEINPASEAVFNQDGIDMDFRVESDANSHALFVRGSDGNVGIGASNPSKSIEILASTPAIRLEDTAGGSKRLDLSVNNSAEAKIEANQSASTMIFNVTNTEAVRYTAAGAVFNEGSADKDFRVETNTSAYTLFVDGGTNNIGMQAATWGHTHGVGVDLQYDGSMWAGSPYWAGGLKTGTNFYGTDAGDKYKHSGRYATEVYHNSQGGVIKFYTADSGTANGVIPWKSMLELGRTESVFNEGSVDRDFRIESDGNAHMVFVDGGSNIVGIGLSNPSTTNSTVLEAQANATGATSPIRTSNRAVTAGTAQGAGIDFGLARNSGAYKPQAGRIVVGRNDDWTNDDAKVDAYMAFSTYTNNLNVEYMRISPDTLRLGNANDNVTVDISASNAKIKLIDNNQSNPPTLVGNGPHFTIENGGVERFRIGAGANGVVVNETGVDQDFRVESDSNTHMLFVDGGNNRVGIGRSPTSGKLLEVAGDIQLTNNNASLWLKSGVSGTAGKINWTYNTDATVFASAGIDYDTRASTGWHLDVGYPITIDSASGAGITFYATGTAKNIFSNSSNVFNEHGADIDFRVESDANQHALFVDGGNNRVGVLNSNPQSALDVVGPIASRIGTYGALTTGILEISPNTISGSGLKIVTSIPWSTGSTHAHTVTIKGFAYESSRVVDLKISWHKYNNSFYNRTANSSGAWAPAVTLAVESDKVVIHLTSPGYWPKIYVESLYNAYGDPSHAQGWTWADAAISADAGTPNETVAYKTDLGNGFKVDSSGTIINDNSLDADFRVESNGNTHMLFVDGGANAVGIGTVPARKLHVMQDSDGDGIRLSHSGRATSTYWDQELSGVNNEAIVFRQYDGSSEVTAYAMSRTNHQFNVSGTQRFAVSANTGIVATPAANGHAVFNEGGVDADFRVESDTQTHMLFVDGGNNAVGIGTSGPIRTLHVNSAATSDIARFDNNSGGMTFGYAGTQASIDLATSAAFRIRQGSVVPLTISTAGDLLLGTTSKAGAGGITLDSGGSWSNINLYGAGTSQGGRLYFGDSSDRASIVGQYGSGGGGQLTFNTDTTGGTSLQRVKIDNSGNVFFNGVREYHQSMSLNNGTAYTFDIPIQSTGAGYTMTYECMYNHFGNTSYGSWQSGFLSFRSLNNSAYSVDMTKNHAPSGSGGWTVSMVGGGTATPSIRFTKSAGTYGGAGYGHIFIRGGKS